MVLGVRPRLGVAAPPVVRLCGCGSDAAAGSGRPELWKVRGPGRGSAAAPRAAAAPASCQHPVSRLRRLRTLAVLPAADFDQPARLTGSGWSLPLCFSSVSWRSSCKSRTPACRPSVKENPCPQVVGICAVSGSFRETVSPALAEVHTGSFVLCLLDNCQNFYCLSFLFPFTLIPLKTVM